MVPAAKFSLQPTTRFPRASGDGPDAAHQYLRITGFPPRERGWSLLPAGHNLPAQVSPARAGMVLLQGHPLRWPFRFPCASGDGPNTVASSMRVRTFPPRERGWSRPNRCPVPEDVVSPARAGMVPVGHQLGVACDGFPRASGDGPLERAAEATVSAFPPRERGWSLATPVRGRAQVVSPARAGMVRGQSRVIQQAVGFPRASGDGPSELLQLLDHILFPPRERGWSPLGHAGNLAASVSPARAGMVPAYHGRRLPASRFPRASGDGPVTISHGGAMATFPPRERGWSLSCLPSNWSSAVSPARAGMVPGRQVQRARCIRFPRASGDGPQPAARLPG